MASRVRRIEWPTMALLVLIYGLWLGLTWFHAAIPWPVLLLGGGWSVAWHGSLQHELIHGHPTRWPGINRALGLPPLALFLPFDRYRKLHLAHHRNHHLTDPLEDPETQYWTEADWRALHPLARMVARGSARLAIRLVIGPVWAIGRFLYSEAKLLNDRTIRAAWAGHLPMLALVLVWVRWVCGMSLPAYLLCFVLPGCSLLLIRSFAEHRAALDEGQRTAVVENARLLGVLYLFNNLHAAHHERPGLAWYRLPGWYRQERERLLRRNGNLVYDGYAEVMRRFFMAPHDALVHPFDGASPPARVAGPAREPYALPVISAGRSSRIGAASNAAG
jgi:fatty acid desaturase